MSEETTRRLREAARAHQPDHARMLDRVERGLTGTGVRHRTPPLTKSGPRAVLAGLAIAGLLATGGFAVADIVRSPSPSAIVTSPTDSPTTTPRPTPSDTAVSLPPSPTAAPGGSRPARPADTRVQDGPMWSGGSIGQHSTVYWAESDLALRTTQPLTSLTVEMSITQTGGLQSTGSWRTLPSDDFTVTVRQVGAALVYRWVLKPGRTVPAGQHEFAAQYNHATGVRDASADSYRVDAQTSAGSPAAVWGRFSPP